MTATRGFPPACPPTGWWPFRRACSCGRWHCRYTYELEVGLLLNRDEDTSRTALAVAQGVAAAMSDAPIDPLLFVGVADTDDEADAAASRTNTRRAMASVVASRGGR